MEDTVIVAEQEQDQENLDLVGLETSYGVEVDLHKHLSKCKKNPGHHQFIPIDKFNVEHLPPGCHDNEIMDLVRAQADLTVRVSARYVSEKRPEIDPNSEKPYPFSNKRGCSELRYGTGWIDSIVKYLPEIGDARGETCKCKECLNSPTPKIQFAHIYIYTAAHVVYDYLEADHTTCHLFFDRGNKPQNCSGVVTLTEPSYVFGDINTDVCQLIYTTHDLALADKLEGMIDRHAMVTNIVNIKYFSSMSENLVSLHEDKSLYDDINQSAIDMKFIKTGMNMLFRVHYETMNYSLPQEQSKMLSFIETFFRCRRHMIRLMIDGYVGAGKQSGVENSHAFINDCVHHVLEMIKEFQSLFYEKFRDCELKPDFNLNIQQIGSFTKYLFDQISGIKVESDKLHLLPSSEILQGIYENIKGFIKHFQNFIITTNFQSNIEFQHSGAFIHGLEKCIHVYNQVLEKIRYVDHKSENKNSQSEVRSVNDSLHTLTIIVSHPHGCSKQVSIGHYTKQDVESDPSSKLAYTTATCPGSSGAHVCMMERSHLCQYVHVGNSQRNTKLNYSGSLWDIPLD